MRLALFIDYTAKLAIWTLAITSSALMGTMVGYLIAERAYKNED